MGHCDPRQGRQYGQPRASFPRQLDQELGSPPAGVADWHLPFTPRLSRHLRQQPPPPPPPQGPPRALDWLRSFPISRAIGRIVRPSAAGLATYYWSIQIPNGHWWPPTWRKRGAGETQPRDRGKALALMNSKDFRVFEVAVRNPQHMPIFFLDM